MPIVIKDLDKSTRAAVRDFWKARNAASEKQVSKGVSDVGGRSAVTGGKHMDGFIKLIRQVVVDNGLPANCVLTQKRDIPIPGFFRATKEWDIVIVKDRKLVAAVELKSQVGPSFGNNFNNRTEEVIGAAKDFWVAYREGAFGDSTEPFLGYLTVVEDCDKSRGDVTSSSPNFDVFDEFEKSSYLERYRLLCQKLMSERLYSSAAVLAVTAPSNKRGSKFTALDANTGIQNFVAELAAQVSKFSLKK